MGYLIWLIIRTVQWDSKIPPVIGMLLSAVMLVGGLSAIPEVVETVGDFCERASAAIEIVLPRKDEAPEEPQETEAPEETDAAAN